jgi:hypothetical protein
MYEYVKKPKENRNRAIANSVTQKKSGVKQGFGFVDNRPETVTQRKLQEMVKNSQQVSKATSRTITEGMMHMPLQRGVHDSADTPKDVFGKSAVLQLTKGKTAKKAPAPAPGVKKKITKAKHKPKYVVYNQTADPTLAPYLPKGSSIIASNAVKNQRKKQNPGKIRVDARKMKNTTMGQGLHEVLPTSEGPKVSKIAKDPMRDMAAQIQSGMRTTPALTPLVNPHGGTSGHTGTYVHPAKPRASQNTSGQAGAHDVLRKALQDGLKTDDPEQLFYTMAEANLRTVPSGEDMLADGNLTGCTPNLTDAVDSVELARIVHERREKAKDRTRTVYDSMPPKSKKNLREPSPERESIDKHGKGGGYAKKKQKRDRSPEPKFPATDTHAHKAAWLTESMRLDSFQ